jgi:RNA polymerase sigma-70 factor (ECF subfamily)
MGERPRTRRSLNADERALLDTLVQECGPRLLAYVRRVYGSRLDAEDIVAETFCRAAANVGALQRCERQDLYLLTIARNLCCDCFRRAGEHMLAHQRPDEPAHVSPPDESTTRREERNALLDAVDALPAAQREVVTLRLSTDLKFEQIAELLGAPLGTVLSRMHAAVRRLKQQLGCVHER